MQELANASAARVRAAVRDLAERSFRPDEQAASLQSALDSLVAAAGARSGVIMAAVDGSVGPIGSRLAGQGADFATWAPVFAELEHPELEHHPGENAIEVQVGRPPQPGLVARLRGGGRTQAWLGLLGVSSARHAGIAEALEAWCAALGAILDVAGAIQDGEEVAIRDAVMRHAGLGFVVGRTVAGTPFADIRHWSPTMAELSASDRAMIGEGGLFPALSATEQQARRLRDVALDVQRRREQRQLEWRVRDGRGGERVLSVVITPRGGDDSIELLLIAIDVTGRWTTIEVAHDFRGLLQRILGNLSLVEHELTTDGTAVADLVSQVREASEHAAELCRSVLDDGHDPAVWAEVDLSREVTSIRSLLRGLASAGVEVEIDASTPVPTVRADGLRIRRMLLNLVRNAVHAIGSQGGTVRVTTGVQVLDDAAVAGLDVDSGIGPGRYVTIEVGDDGCGMDPTTRRNALLPGYSTHADGHGIGLASVADTVRAHRGGLAVQTAPGLGSRFTVFLPAPATKDPD